MNDLDAEQGMLFGALGSDHTAPATDHSPPGTVRVCALNVANPNRMRARQLAQWLLGRGDDVLVLTEMKPPSDGGRELLGCLRAEGYTITPDARPDTADDPYSAVIATRGLPTTPVDAGTVGPRIAALDLHVGDRTLRVVGIYAPTNGMTSESSHRRSVFQRHVIDYLTRIATPGLLLAGDLNVIEPGHQPRLPAFEPHDYGFYTDLIALGLRDAYRELHPDIIEHSWFSDRFGDQRIDHTFVGTDTGALTMCSYDHSPRITQISDHAAMVTALDYTVDAHPTEAGASR